MSANKQFISPIPIRLPEGDDEQKLDELGKRLHRQAKELNDERNGFLTWLTDAIGTRPSELEGSTILAHYDEYSPSQLLGVLGRNAGRIHRDVGSRAFRERFERELVASIDKIRSSRSVLAVDEAAADDAVFDMYGLTGQQRGLVESEVPGIAST